MTTDKVYFFILIVHILGGFVGMVSGAVAIFAGKGQLIHRTAGKAFSLGMVTAGVTTLGLVALKPNFILTLIAIFTVYLVVTGVLASRGGGANTPKYAIISLFVITAVLFCMIFLGYRAIVVPTPFLIPAIIFSFWASLLVFGDLHIALRSPVKRVIWRRRHLFRMLLGMNFALGAFFVTNAELLGISLPNQYAGALPNMVMLPLMIAYWFIVGGWTNERVHS